MKVSITFFAELLLYCVSWQAKPALNPLPTKKPMVPTVPKPVQTGGFMAKPLYPGGYLAQQKQDKLKLKKSAPKAEQVGF